MQRTAWYAGPAILGLLVLVSGCGQTTTLKSGAAPSSTTASSPSADTPSPTPAPAQVVDKSNSADAGKITTDSTVNVAAPDATALVAQTFPGAKPVTAVPASSPFDQANITKDEICPQGCSLFLATDTDVHGNSVKGATTLIAAGPGVTSAKIPGIAPAASGASLLDDNVCQSVNTSATRLVVCSDSSGNVIAIAYNNDGTATVSGPDGSVTVPQSAVPADPDPSPSPAPEQLPSGTLVWQGFPMHYQCTGGHAGTVYNPLLGPLPGIPILACP